MAKPLTIAAARDRIATLNAERSALLNGPRDHASVRADISNWCATQAAIGEARIGQHIVGVAFGGDLNTALTVRAAPSGVVDLAPMLAAMLGGDALCAALCKHLDLTECGPTVAERAERIAAIEREMLETEIAEERLIEATEAAGMPIARRADADPRAVLGLPS